MKALKNNLPTIIIVVGLICWLCFFLPDTKAQGHYATGKLDTIMAEIITTAITTERDNPNIKGFTIIKKLVIIDGFIEREKYSYMGDPMPNGLPNNGGVYDDYYITKKYLDNNLNEIKGYVWMARELGKK